MDNVIMTVTAASRCAITVKGARAPRNYTIIERVPVEVRRVAAFDELEGLTVHFDRPARYHGDSVAGKRMTYPIYDGHLYEAVFLHRDERKGALTVGEAQEILATDAFVYDIAQPFYSMYDSWAQNGCPITSLDIREIVHDGRLEAQERVRQRARDLLVVGDHLYFRGEPPCLMVHVRQVTEPWVMYSGFANPLHAYGTVCPVPFTLVELERALTFTRGLLGARSNVRPDNDVQSLVISGPGRGLRRSDASVAHDVLRNLGAMPSNDFGAAPLEFQQAVLDLRFAIRDALRTSSITPTVVAAAERVLQESKTDKSTSTRDYALRTKMFLGGVNEGVIPVTTPTASLAPEEDEVALTP